MMNQIPISALWISFLTVLTICYFSIFYKRNNGFIQFIKYVLLPITFIGGLIIYYIGYHYAKLENNYINTIMTDFFMALFSTGRLFILGNDLQEIEWIKDSPLFYMCYSMIGASAVVISTSILLHLFGKRVITKLKIWFNRSNEIYIFFGVNDASLSLAQDLKKNNSSRLVIFIQKMDKDEEMDLYHKVEDIDALIISMESIAESIQLEKEDEIIHTKKEIVSHLGSQISNIRNLKKLHLLRKVVKRTSHLFFLSDREGLNIDIARSILEEIENSVFNQSVTFHIRTSSGDLNEHFHHSLSKMSSQIRINLLNYSEITARQLIANYNPVDWIEKDTEKAIAKSFFNVLMIGFDNTNIAILVKLIEHGQFIGSHFKASIVDKDLESKKGRFFNRFPGLMSNYSIDFIERGIGSEGYFELINQNLNKLDYILISLGDDDVNIQTAIDLQQLINRSFNKPVKIIAQVRNNQSYSGLFDPTESHSINILGRNKDVYTEDIIVRGSMERSAKKVHEYYNSLKDISKRKNWHELTRIEQFTNISAAEHIYTKLALCGLKSEDIKKFQNTKQFEDYLGDERKNNLAQLEHLHWNATLFSNGWEKWDLSEIPTDSALNKDNTKKLHACLTDWNELERVGLRFKDDFRKYDVENVINIFDLINEGIYEIKQL